MGIKTSIYRNQNRIVILNEKLLHRLARAVEVYPRETMGLLWGTRRRQNFEGKKRKVLSVKSAYPVQTAIRKWTKVGWGSDIARAQPLKIYYVHIYITPFEHNSSEIGYEV